MLNAVKHLGRTAWSVLRHERYEILRLRAQNDTLAVSQHTVSQFTVFGSALHGVRSEPGSDPVAPTVYWLAIVTVVVDVGHLTQRMHIFHESQVPSQQT
jgi:hypothetical protein